jgi:ribosomal protein L12E/L44/L45/RPP1/RPP2
LIGNRKYHMKDQCVIYYGQIQMVSPPSVSEEEQSEEEQSEEEQSEEEQSEEEQSEEELARAGPLDRSER